MLTVATLLAGLFTAAMATAQPVGTFKWQQMPYCNLVTVSVVQNGGAYTLDGTDDGCGVRPFAVSGIGYPRASGAIGLGLVIVTAGGAPLHLDVTLPAGSVNGSWSDSTGQTAHGRSRRVQGRAAAPGRRRHPCSRRDFRPPGPPSPTWEHPWPRRTPPTGRTSTRWWRRARRAPST
jgi:hypothetical protein